MGMAFLELDAKTRLSMMQEFEREESGPRPYGSKVLSAEGRNLFPDLMRQAILNGDEETLLQSLLDPGLWIGLDARGRRVNVPQRAEGLATTEFATWYVRGLAKRLLDEGVADCVIYRAGLPRHEAGDCSCLEECIVSVQAVYDGHRAKYWPEPGDRSAFSVPFGPTCHHSIKRPE